MILNLPDHSFPSQPLGSFTQTWYWASCLLSTVAQCNTADAELSAPLPFGILYSAPVNMLTTASRHRFTRAACQHVGSLLSVDLLKIALVYRVRLWNVAGAYSDGDDIVRVAVFRCSFKNREKRLKEKDPTPHPTSKAPCRKCCVSSRRTMP